MVHYAKKILKGLNQDEYEHPFDRKALDTLEATHPWIVMRASELLKWQDEGLYDALLKRGRSPIAIRPATAKSKPQINIKPKK